MRSKANARAAQCTRYDHRTRCAPGKGGGAPSTARSTHHLYARNVARIHGWEPAADRVPSAQLMGEEGALSGDQGRGERAAAIMLHRWMLSRSMTGWPAPMRYEGPGPTQAEHISVSAHAAARVAFHAAGTVGIGEVDGRNRSAPYAAALTPSKGLGCSLPMVVASTL